MLGCLQSVRLLIQSSAVHFVSKVAHSMRFSCPRISTFPSPNTSWISREESAHSAERSAASFRGEHAMVLRSRGGGRTQGLWSKKWFDFLSAERSDYAARAPAHVVDAF